MQGAMVPPFVVLWMEMPRWPPVRRRCCGGRLTESPLPLPLLWVASPPVVNFAMAQRDTAWYAREGQNTLARKNGVPLHDAVKVNEAPSTAAPPPPPPIAGAGDEGAVLGANRSPVPAERTAEHASGSCVTVPRALELQDAAPSSPSRGGGRGRGGLLVPLYHEGGGGDARRERFACRGPG